MRTAAITRRTLLAGLAAGALAPAVRAQSFLARRPVKIISPQQAGGSTDAVLRPLAERLSQVWGQPVIVENRPGGGSIIATHAVVQSPPDGHTLGLAINSLTINPSLRKDLPYDTLRDLSPIIQIGSTTVALVVHPSLGVGTLEEFIAYAKGRPGVILWASLGVGTGGHITGELLRKRAGLRMVHVPFSGSSSALRELLPGRVHAAFVVLDSAMPHLQAGSLKLLAVADPRRNRRFPDTPSLEESFPGMGYDGIFGLVGPARMPPVLTQALWNDIAGVLNDPEMRQQLEHQFMDVLASSPADFAGTIARGILHWRGAVLESGASVS